jgi:membrane associated rhomboid family serine protease
MCRSCGSIVGAGEPRCAVCGAPTGAATQQPSASTIHHDRETIRFARAILDRPYKFTIIFLVLNLFAFLLRWEACGLSTQVLFGQFPEGVLIAFGAKINYLINSPNREWWRFVTPMFLHVNLIHLLINMYSLWILGPLVEKLYGSAKFVTFWILTGIAGVVASYLTVRPSLATNALSRFIFKDHDVVSAGASGALFGLVGVLFIFGIKFRHELPEGFKRAFGTGMLPVILINLLIGFIGRFFIDNAAHLGGLVAGAGLALVVQYRRPGEKRGVAISWRVLQVLLLLLALVSFYKVARRIQTYLEPSVHVARQNDTQRVLVTYLAALNGVQESVAKGIYEGDLSNADVSATIALQVPPPDSKATELRDRLLVILSRVKAHVAAAPSPLPGPRQPAKPDENLVKEFKAWKQDYEAWLSTVTQSQ